MQPTDIQPGDEENLEKLSPDEQTPFTPADAGNTIDDGRPMPQIDYPSKDTGLDAHEIYDEGINADVDLPRQNQSIEVSPLEPIDDEDTTN